MRFISIFLFFITFFSINENAQAQETSFFSDKEHGWFWYEEPPVEEEIIEEPPEEIIPAPPAPEPKKEEKVEVPSVLVGPSPMSVEWFQKELPRYRNIAIDNPTEENVAVYMYLQRVGMDKASAFADMTKTVVMNNPILDEQTRRPLSNQGGKIMDRQAATKKEALLSEISKKAGIFFFFRSDCIYCHAQAPILKVIERRFGFTVFPISIDAKAMPNGLYSDFKIDNGQSEKLGVISTPALFLVSPPNKIVPISQGILSLNDLKSRLILSSYESEVITEKQYDSTRPINSLLTINPKVEDLTEDILNDPPRLIEFMKNSLNKSYK